MADPSNKMSTVPSFVSATFTAVTMASSAASPAWALVPRSTTGPVISIDTPFTMPAASLKTRSDT